MTDPCQELRVGIVGAGLIGGVHARAYAATPGVRVVAVVDPVPGKADHLAEEYGAIALPTVDALLASDLDIVSVCTPTPTHADVAVPALQSGRHVLCEKPIARTVELAERIRAAEREATGLLMIGHVTRFEPDHSTAAQLVADGTLGELRMLSHSITTSLPAWSQGGWIADFAQSGGPLVDLAVHSFDYLAWVNGARATRVTCVGADTAAGTATYASATVRYSNGAIGLVETSWAHPPSHGFKLGVELVGSDGRLSWDYDSIADGFLHRRSAETVRYDPLGELGYRAEVAAFVEAIRTGAPSPVSGADGVAALQTSLAALESLRSGRTVEVSQVMDR